MANKKTMTRRTSSKKGTTKKAPKKNNFQKWIAYMKKYPPSGGMPIPAGNTIVVTARKQGDVYVPDRTYAELVDSFNNGIFPLLRVISGNDIYFYPLNAFESRVFVFEYSSVAISPDKITTTVVSTYKYSPDGFVGATDSARTQNIDIGYIQV
jgi:hypothetical protein